MIDLKLVYFFKENDESVLGKGRKRAPPRGRGRGSAQSSKRGRKSDNSAIHLMSMNKDDDDDDDDDDNVAKRLNKSQPRVGLYFFSLALILVVSSTCKEFQSNANPIVLPKSFQQYCASLFPILFSTRT